MAIEILVTNQMPERTDDAPEPLLQILRDYAGPEAKPFLHQAEVWRRHMLGAPTYVVAGTASGKTLAEAVPLFYKLFRAPQRERIRRVVWMYPTVALLEDQRRVLRELALKLAQDPERILGQIQGGMSRSELMAALIKPVVLATPDELYWFFRKNVKYSGLLIYGLATVDEWVLDEAHLFSGLALCNLSHLKRRINLLANRLGRRTAWHVLTATPSPALDSFADGSPIQGRSKCGDIRVTFLAPVEPNRRADALRAEVSRELVAGARKVLLVMNSAAAAHRLFEALGRQTPGLPLRWLWRFGWTNLAEIEAWLGSHGFTESARRLSEFARREEPPYLSDLPPGNNVSLPADLLASTLSRVLETQGARLRSIAYSVQRETTPSESLASAVETRVEQRSRLGRALWSTVRTRLGPRPTAADVADEIRTLADCWQDALARAWGTQLSCTPPELPELKTSLVDAGLPGLLAGEITKYLAATLPAPEEALADLSPVGSGRRPKAVCLGWLDWLVAEEERQFLAEQLESSLLDGTIRAVTRHITTWDETKVPALLYTGQMSRSARRGLIEAFGDPDIERAVLVSTSAVEVGVDFAVDALVTEQCDGSAFRQRFGRVGRREGTQGKVVALVHDGQAFGRLSRAVASLEAQVRPSEHAADPGSPPSGACPVTMTRTEFSQLIAHPEGGAFPPRRHLTSSAYLNATHHLVNGQLGRIGAWLNEHMFPELDTTRLSDAMRQAELSFGYGLRETLPGVSLWGGAGGDPFYVLSRIGNQDLVPSDCPFEIARAEVSYTEFIWRKSEWTVLIDWERTLAGSQQLFYWLDGAWHLASGHGIAADYVKARSWLSKPPFRQLLQQDPMKVLSLVKQATGPGAACLRRLGGSLLLCNEPHAPLVLGQGDVFLRRVHRDGGELLVEDRLGEPLPLREQMWLFILVDKGAALAWLKAADLLEVEELHLDRDGTYVMLLDRMSGACLAAYERLMKYVG